MHINGVILLHLFMKPFSKNEKIVFIFDSLELFTKCN
jgi:hypothetical protein